MKTDYWNVTDDQVTEKTGKSLSEWNAILEAFNAMEKGSNEVVKHLQDEYAVPRYWAITLVTRFTKEQKGEL